MKRLLLTGVGGAIGVHCLAHVMHNTDWEVVGVDSFRHKGYFDRITTTFNDHPDWVERTKIVTHDLNAPLTSRQVAQIGRIDYIVNMAARSDVQNSIDDPIPFIKNNTDLMLNVLEYARLVKPEVFIQFSTDEVYGPAPFTSGGHVEWEPIIPSNPYSASKACQEAICIAWWRCYGVPIIITNTMNNFSEMQAPSKFPAMIQKKLSKGEKVQIHSASDGQIGSRFYIHSRNVSDALLFIINNTKPTLHNLGYIDKPDRYNIVGDIRLNNLELAQKIASLMDKELEYELVDFHTKNPGHDLHYGLDGTKLKELGWQSPLSFEESMKNTIEWQQKHKEWLE